MPSKSFQSSLLAVASGVMAYALFRWAHRAFSNNIRLGAPHDFSQMVLHAPYEFSWVRHSWILAALILVALPICVVKRSVTAILIAELLGFAFAFLEVLWDVGTLPGPHAKFDLRLLHPASVGLLIAQVCAAGTLASTILAIRCYGDDDGRE